MNSIGRRSVAAGARRRALLLGLVVAGVLEAAATAALGTTFAASTCNARLAIDYVSGANFPNPGDVVRVRLTIGAGSIQNGTTFTMNRIRFDLDCANPPPPGSVPCADDGLVIGYQGDSTITTTCAGVSFSTGHAIGGTPNEVVFTPSTAIAIPANTAAFCNIEFDVKVLGPSNDSTPTVAEEVAGYNSATGDGQCDNGLSSSGAQSGSITLCPVCNDNNPCTTDSCNNATGECQHVNQCTTTTTSTTTSTTSTTSATSATSTSTATTTTSTSTSSSSSTTSTTAPTCTDLGDVFEINYFANVNAGLSADATVSITNPGTHGAPSPAGDLCALIYVFSADQQMAECCGCPVTPNGLRTLSVTTDLTSNPLTGVKPRTGVIKIVSSTTCDPASPTPTPELIAWATHIQTPDAAVAITKTAFEDAKLCPAELTTLREKCADIIDNGSGHGVCTCGASE